MHLAALFLYFDELSAKFDLEYTGRSVNFYDIGISSPEWSSSHA
jgi:hypothetical protein